jgi:hypothetical protein
VTFTSPATAQNDPPEHGVHSDAFARLPTEVAVPAGRRCWRAADVPGGQSLPAGQAMVMVTLSAGDVTSCGQ